MHELQVHVGEPCERLFLDVLLATVCCSTRPSRGGAGGGGRGGPSVAIAWVGTQPVERGTVDIDIPATAAPGGAGGNGGAGNIGGMGADGILEARKEWTE
ncbi:MAG: hypothetical protein JNK04_23490 [Myxococcales bacterium]|nr:hypothetical protein [Myxococcales bacterium]